MNILKPSSLGALVLLCLVVAPIGGCSTKNINERYSAQLSELSPGDSLEKFKQVMPKAVVAGQNSVGGRKVDAYEITHDHMYDAWYGFTREEKLWFYFWDSKLVKWGPPGSWPEPADLTVDIR